MQNCLNTLVCPICKSRLQITDKGLSCPNHKEHYGIDRNIIRMSSVPIPFHILDKEERLEKDIEKADSIEELKSIISKEYGPLYSYIFHRSRADYVYLLSKLSLHGVDLFLDVGAGFGSIITRVSDKVMCPFALDAAQEKSLFTAKWSKLEGCRVVSILGDAFSLPFQDSVDVALMNGVLEWVGESKRIHERVEEVQVEALKKIRDTLKDDGTLIIAIENRFNPFYLREREHGGLRFTSFLPRKIANFISQIQRKKPYRIYTYNYWEYLNLLNKAGFGNVKIFGCYPNYREPRFTYSLEDEKALKFLASNRHLFGSRISNAFFAMSSRSLALGRLLSPSFVIFASKGKIDTTNDFVGSLAISGSGSFVKIIDLERRQVMSMQRERKIPIFNNIESKPATASAPATITYNKEQGYTVEELVEGQSLGSLRSVLRLNRHKGLRLVERAFDELYRFHSSQNPSYVKIKEYANSLRTAIEKYSDLDFARPYIEELSHTDFNGDLGERTIPLLYAHGDFYTNNILYSDSSGEIYIVDWEYGRKASGLYDILYFIALYSFFQNKDDFLKRLFQDHPPKRDIEKILSNILTRYFALCHIDRKALRAVFSIFLLERLLVLLEMGLTTFDADREYSFLLWANRLLDISGGES